MPKLEVGVNVNAAFMVKRLERKLSKKNEHFLIGELYDKDGTYQTCIWHKAMASPGSRDMVPGDIIYADWEVKEYKNELQLDVANLQDVKTYSDPTVGDLAQWIRTSYLTKEAWVAYYEQFVEPLIEDKPIKDLIRVLVVDGKKFWASPAAKAMHHSHRGGLAEHTHHILRLFRGMVDSGHPQINKCRRGLIIAGIILHDWGKCFEYQEVSPGVFDYSTWGVLVGHLAGGPIMFARIIERQGIKFDDQLWMHLQHVLLAHHGQTAWGSPVEPRTMEAWVVHQLDNTDGKLWMFDETKNMEYNRGVGGKVVHFKAPVDPFKE